MMLAVRRDQELPATTDSDSRLVELDNLSIAEFVARHVSTSRPACIVINIEAIGFAKA
jgi:hypothetical protein